VVERSLAVFGIAVTVTESVFMVVIAEGETEVLLFVVEKDVDRLDDDDEDEDTKVRFGRLVTEEKEEDVDSSFEVVVGSVGSFLFSEDRFRTVLPLATDMTGGVICTTEVVQVDSFTIDTGCDDDDDVTPDDDDDDVIMCLGSVLRLIMECSSSSSNANGESLRSLLELELSLSFDFELLLLFEVVVVEEVEEEGVAIDVSDDDDTAVGGAVDTLATIGFVLLDITETEVADIFNVVVIGELVFVVVSALAAAVVVLLFEVEVVEPVAVVEVLSPCWCCIVLSAFSLSLILDGDAVLLLLSLATYDKGVAVDSTFCFSDVDLEVLPFLPSFFFCFFSEGSPATGTGDLSLDRFPVVSMMMFNDSGWLDEEDAAARAVDLLVR